MCKNNEVGEPKSLSMVVCCDNLPKHFFKQTWLSGSQGMHTVRADNNYTWNVMSDLNQHLHQTVQSLHSQLFSGGIKSLFVGNIGRAVSTEVDNLTEPDQHRQRRAHL